MNQTATKIAFETQYSDGSGVEFAVRYDASRDEHDGGRIEFENIDTVAFPAHRIDWLIACLERIRAEIDAPEGA